MKKLTGLILAVMVLSLALVGCQPIQPAAPGASAAEFSNVRFTDNFIYVQNADTGVFYKVTFPTFTTSLVIASGTVSLIAGNTTTTVTHGMGVAPTRIVLTPEAGVLGTASSSTGYNAVYPASIGATTFVVTAMVATNTTRTIDWLAIVQ